MTPDRVVEKVVHLTASPHCEATMLGDEPLVERVDIVPRWVQAQQEWNDRARRSANAVPTASYGRLNFNSWFDACEFTLATEGEWTDRGRVHECFRSEHALEGDVHTLERESFMDALGQHLAKKFAQQPGSLRRRKEFYNVTCSRVGSTKLQAGHHTNKKLFRKMNPSSRKSQDPNRSRLVSTRSDDSTSSRYMTEFLQLNCAVGLLESKLFPDAKELTESFAAFNAWRTYLRHDFDSEDPGITLVSVGDGCTPRTAALFAFRTRWHCIAVDPEMGLSRDSKSEYNIARLQHFRAKIEELKIVAKRVLVVCVHAHVSLATTLSRIFSDDGTASCIAIPCCNYYAAIDAEGKVVPEYEDMGVISPHRTVRIWKSLPCGSSSPLCQAADA